MIAALLALAALATAAGLGTVAALLTFAADAIAAYPPSAADMARRLLAALREEADAVAAGLLLDAWAVCS